jgi:hypothetical protein
MPTTISLQIPFEFLLQALQMLSPEEKYTLLERLEDDLFQSEEDIETDPVVAATVLASRQAYQQGDYVKIEDYIASASQTL